MGRFAFSNLLVAGMVAGALCASATEQEDGNYMPKNGDFEEGMTHWNGFLSDYLKETDKDAPEENALLEWEEDDTADNSEGALRLQISNFDKLLAGYEDAGVAASLGTKVKENTKLEITFDAKRINGSPYLIVCYPDKVYGMTGVRLEDEWKTYTSQLTVGEDTDKLLFTLAQKTVGINNDVRNGSALIDNVKISKVEK